MPESIRLKTWLVVSEFQNGRVLAHPVCAPELASYGARAQALEEQALFLTHYLEEQDAATLSRFMLPDTTRLESVAVSLPRSDLQRRSQLPCELEVHGVVIPDSRGDWVELLSPRHTLFVAHGEDFREVVSREVKRVVAALDPKPAEFFALIPPALGCSLEPLEIELELVTDPGGGSVAQRRARLTLREQRRRALEVLGSVSQRWQRSRDELRDTQASGGPTWLLHRQSESGQLASLLGAQVRSSVLLVGDESSGRQALLQSWFEAAAVSGRAADVYATSAAQLLAGMSGLGQWQARLTRVMEAAELLDAVLYFDDLADLFGDHANSQIDIPRAMLRYLQDGRVRVVGRITPELLNALQPRNASFFGAFHSLRVAALSAAQTADIISASARASATQRVRLAPRSAAQLVALVDRYDPYRSLPGKAVRFYDELLAAFERESTQEQVLEARDVQTWLSRQTGIPERLLREDQAQRPSDVEEKLGSELVGQTAAVRAVSEAIAVIKAGLQPTGRPLANLLFIGPTGVGKTELARALAGFLFGSPDRLLRFDMSEYRDGLAAERLIHGTDREEGLLTRAVRRQPFSVLLLDEIEKASDAVFDLLLGVLGEARLSDANGRTSYFHNCLIIMTSNLGATHSTQNLGLVRGGVDLAKSHASAVNAHFRPEFINRIDRVVPFQRLTHPEIERVLRLLLAKSALRRGFVERGIELVLSDDAQRWLAEQGYSAVYGARALRRELEDRVLAPVAELLSRLGGEAAGSRVVVRLSAERPAGGVLGQVTRGALRIDLERSSARRRPKSEIGVFTAVAQRAALGRRWLRLDPIDELKTRIEYVRVELSQSTFVAARQQKSRRTKLPGVQIERLSRELGELQQWWDALLRPIADLNALEELAFAALLDGEPSAELLPEAEQAERALRLAVVPALLAREEARDEILLLVRELDAGGALAHWWQGFPESARQRGWQVGVHPPASLIPATSSLHRGGFWSDPKPPNWLTEQLSVSDRKPLQVLLAVRGPFANALLALELGLQAVMPTERGQTKPSMLNCVRLSSQVVRPKAVWDSKLAPPPTPELMLLHKLPRCRVHHPTDGLVELGAPLPKLQLAPGQYWSELEAVALPQLLRRVELNLDGSDADDGS